MEIPQRAATRGVRRVRVRNNRAEK
jgi:hypothetical protein